ncbi:MAG: hypothetical protein WB608_21360 [Terracidiphilus sp.]
MDASRRDILKAASIWLVDQWACSRRFAFGDESSSAAGRDDRKVIIVACGGIRRAETFFNTGLGDIPHLYHDLLPRSVFYPLIRNAGVTSHYNTISSILTGNWQRLDDWGMTPPANPTFFEYLRKRMELSQDNAWLISSNKALTNRIGASSIRGFGPRYGANVVFPKQLLINAVIQAASQGHPEHRQRCGTRVRTKSCGTHALDASRPSPQPTCRPADRLEAMGSPRA